MYHTYLTLLVDFPVPLDSSFCLCSKNNLFLVMIDHTSSVVFSLKEPRSPATLFLSSASRGIPFRALSWIRLSQPSFSIPTGRPHGELPGDPGCWSVDSRTGPCGLGMAEPPALRGPDPVLWTGHWGQCMWVHGQRRFSGTWGSRRSEGLTDRLFVGP